MTERAPGSGSAGLADPAQRGRLDIANRVVERIATYAAGEVSGVTNAGSTLERAIGRQYPKATAEVAGGRTRVDVEIAVTWPLPLAQVGSAVRDRVRSRVHQLAGLEVDAVHVSAAKVVRAEPEPTRRVL